VTTSGDETEEVVELRTIDTADEVADSVVVVAVKPGVVRSCVEEVVAAFVAEVVATGVAVCGVETLVERVAVVECDGVVVSRSFVVETGAVVELDPVGVDERAVAVVVVPGTFVVVVTCVDEVVGAFVVEYVDCSVVVSAVERVV
jgi:hypothetical protein